MNDEQQLLASAYLDGALTDEERARAEADPDVMAAVEQLRELRRALAVVDPPNPARRDAAINAALDAFDAEHAPAAPPSVSPLRRRRMNTWLIGAAAAALVAVVAGGILATRGDDGGGDGASTAGDAGGAQVTQEVLSGGAESAGTSQPAAVDTRAGDDGASTASEATAGVAPATTGAPASTYSAAHAPRPASQLEQVASSMLSTGRAANDAAPRCDGGRFLGHYVLTIRGKNTAVEIFYNRRAEKYIALDAHSCKPLVSTPAR
jgi:hypothetical protein